MVQRAGPYQNTIAGRDALMIDLYADVFMYSFFGIYLGRQRKPATANMRSYSQAFALWLAY